MSLDPNYLYDNADVIWYGTEGYANALRALQKVTGKSETAVEMMLNGKYGAADYWTAVEALKDQGVVVARNTNGYRCFAYASDVTMTAPTGAISSIDSNATATTIVKANPVYDVVVDDVPTSASYGKVLTNPVGNVLTPEHGFHGWKFFAGEAVQAISAAGAGISLGKTFDSTLYNAFPDFFDSHGMSSFNPETWASITNGDDSFAAGLFNTIFGIDPNNGHGQMFIDENALAYLAYYMKDKGVFNASVPTVDIIPDGVPSGITIVNSQPTLTTPMFLARYGVEYPIEDFSLHYSEFTNNDSPVYTIAILTDNSNPLNENARIEWRFFSKSSFTRISHGMNSAASNVSSSNSSEVLNIDGKKLHLSSSATYNYNFKAGTGAILPASVIDYAGYLYDSLVQPNTTDALNKYLWSILYSSEMHEGGVEGIGTQDGATTPDASGWNDYDDVLPSLQQQYPDLWDNAVPNTIVQPDGSTKTIVYVPIAMPNANGQWDTQPTSSTTSQADPQVQPQPQPTPQNNDLLKLLLQQITMPQPNPETQPQPQPQPQPNIPTPTTTGTGDTPTPVPPAGSASALWSVYHPTQAQVNSFGAWLWTDNIIQRIQQVLQNPMEGIITLHKVFGMPVDSGQGTIVVGRLDSQVPSATVTQQYITVDCGSVDCVEEFGTVFDYPPYTEISLYLPFIGIVSLNVNDIMRSQIHITYGIDVFTGACLAMVEVTRDANVVNMYQYSGVASVEYPLTGSMHGGLITGLLGIAGGVATTIATGGVTAPAALAAAGGLASASKSNMGRASGFSGNSGAMGIKNPYLIIERPQVKTAETFPNLAGFPTNYSLKLGDCEGHVVVSHVHVEGINATQSELIEIENLLTSGVLV